MSGIKLKDTIAAGLRERLRTTRNFGQKIALLRRLGRDGEAQRLAEALINRRKTLDFPGLTLVPHQKEQV